MVILTANARSTGDTRPMGVSCLHLKNSCQIFYADVYHLQKWFAEKPINESKDQINLMNTMNTNSRILSQRLASAVCAAASLLIISNTKAQNLFEADLESGNIYEYTPGGVQSTFASGLNYPQALAFNDEGDLFVGTFGAIVEFTPSGAQSTFASGLNETYGLAFNSAGDLFDADYSGNIYEYTPGGVRTIFASGLDAPQAIAFNGAGDLFEADFSDNIYEFTPDGARTLFASGLDLPGGLAFNSTGNLFVTDSGTQNIYEYTPGGVRTTFASGNPASGVNEPGGLAFNSAGNLFETDFNRGNINEFTPSGSQGTFASGLDGAWGLAFQGETLPVPEPATYGLLGIGMTLLYMWRRNIAR